MNFDMLDKKMRQFETHDDRHVLPGVWIVLRMDGRGFTKLTKETLKFQAPFDMKFRDAMVATARDLMGSAGFSTLFGWTSSDELSILLRYDDQTFARKTRKLISVMAGEASASITLHLGHHAVMDARVCELPGSQDVVDYFRWRQEDAARNALNSWVYWTMRKEGKSASTATTAMLGMSVSLKHDYLHGRNINFDKLPDWQKRGVGFFWAEVLRTGRNPLTNETVEVKRRELAVEEHLVYGTEYGEEIRMIVLEDIERAK